MYKFRTIIILLLLQASLSLLFAQQGGNSNVSSDFNEATIRLENGGSSPYEIRFKEGANVTKSDFFDQYRNYFNLSADYQFVQIQEFADLINQIHYRNNLYYRGIEIIGAQFILHEKNGLIHYANGHLVHGLEVDISPLITEQTALQAAINYIGAESYMWEDEVNDIFLKKLKKDPNATYYPTGELKVTTGREKLKSENMKLVYRFNIYAQQPSGNFYVDVDATSGGIVNTIDLIQTGDALGQGLTVYNGPVQIITDSVAVDTFRIREAARGDGIQTLNMQNHPDENALHLAVDFIDPDNNFTEPYDQAGVSVHWALEGTYDYYLTKHGRDSYDNAGGLMKAYAHVGSGLVNAFWSFGLHVMRFGDGGGSLVSIDIVGHELTHGVTELSADLIYQTESGALNESFSDIFGTSIEFFLEGLNGDWLIAEDWPGGAFRSMENPNAFGNPDTYFGNSWVPLTGDDNGGVHTNSGVQNYWFYLLTEGGTGTNDNGDAYSVTGIGLEDAAKIAYRNLTVYLIPSSGYFDARVGALNSVIDLFGSGSQQYLSVVEAWDAVGVYYPFLEQTVSVSPDPVNFEAEINVIPDTMDVVISNLGLQPLIVDNIQVSGTHFEITSSPVLPIELTDLLDNFTISIAFTPADIGTVNETLSIISNDPVSPTKPIPLNGVGFEINQAFTGVLYSSTGTQEDGKTLTVNRTSGAGSELGLSNFDGLNSLTIDPVTNLIFGVMSNDFESELVRVNASGGDAWSLYNFNLSNMVGIGFTSTGSFYGALRSGDIYTIDLTDGSYSLVVTADRQLTSMEIDPMTDIMYAAPRIVIGAGKDRIYTVNTTTGETTLLGQTGFGVTTNDMAFDENGVMYGVIGGSNEEGQLITINTTDAAGTMVGGIGFQNVLGLGYAINGIVNSVTPDDGKAFIPNEFALSQNYPNPFNPSTSIKFSVPVNSKVILTIYNLLGQVVTTLVNEEISAGNYSVIWNGMDKNRLQASSGVYLYKMKANGNNGTPYSQTRKMILLK